MWSCRLWVLSRGHRLAPPPIGLIAVAVGRRLAAAWVSNFGNIQGIVAAVLPILSTLGGIVGGVPVGAFNVLGLSSGLSLQNWQVFALRRRGGGGGIGLGVVWRLLSVRLLAPLAD